MAERHSKKLNENPFGLISRMAGERLLIPEEIKKLEEAVRLLYGAASPRQPTRNTEAGINAFIKRADKYVGQGRGTVFDYLTEQGVYPDSSPNHLRSMLHGESDVPAFPETAATHFGRTPSRRYGSQIPAGRIDFVRIAELYGHED